MKKRILFFIILFSLYIFISCYFYAINNSIGLEDNIFRLHIIANSDSEEDQYLKYKVRDNIISYMNKLCENSSSKEETIEIAQNHINDFKQIADKTISDNNFNYTSTVEIGNYEFPTKYYGNISLPSGYYDALKINIGDAKGKNWWCSLYPPLCFTDVSSGVIDEESQEYLKNNLTDDEYILISKGNEDIKIKFKIVELISKCYNSRPLRYT